jgi:hypothetical protein
LFGAGDTMSNPMGALAQRMVRQARMGVPREAVVMAAAVRSGWMPAEIERLLSEAEATAPLE